MSKSIEQQITDICFENGGVTKPMVDKLVELFNTHCHERERLAREHAIQFALGKINKYSIHTPKSYPKNTVAKQRLNGSLNNWLSRSDKLDKDRSGGELWKYL